MRYQRAFIVTVNGIEVARYKGNPGGAYQVATNHAADIYDEYMERTINGEPEYADYVEAVNGTPIFFIQNSTKRQHRNLTMWSA